MLLIDAEDDRLGKAVGLFQKVRKIARDRLGARFESDSALEVGRLVFIVGDRRGRSGPGRLG